MDTKITIPRRSDVPSPTNQNAHYFQTQAERILLKFGGARRLAIVLKTMGRPRDPATIYKWTYPRERGGTGGIVPTKVWTDIIDAARFDGIVLTMDDMDPRPKMIRIFE